MHRRRVLQAIGGAGIAAMSGFVGTLNQVVGGGWSPGVEGENPTIAPGGESTIRVEATDIGGFQFKLPDPEGINFKISLDDSTVAPSPDSGNDSLLDGDIFCWNVLPDERPEFPGSMHIREIVLEDRSVLLLGVAVDGTPRVRKRVVANLLIEWMALR